jgi:glutathione synthase
MRKDPPYDLNYFFVTHLLDLVPPTTLVVNAPRGLREVTEKLFILRFPELCPESLVSRSIPELLEFRRKLGGEMVIKPLDGCGGEGVFHLTPEDQRPAILEPARHGTTPIAQAGAGSRRRQAHHRGREASAVLRRPRWRRAVPSGAPR